MKNPSLLFFVFLLSSLPADAAEQKQNVAARKARMAQEGSRHVIESCQGTEIAKVCRHATVGELQKSGYGIAIGADGVYRLSDAAGKAIASSDEFHRVLADIDRTRSVKALRAKMAREGDRHVVESCRAAEALDFCVRGTVGELKAAGYRVSLDDAGQYRVEKDGRTNTSLFGVLSELEDQKNARNKARLKKARDMVVGGNLERL